MNWFSHKDDRDEEENLTKTMFSVVFYEIKVTLHKSLLKAMLMPSYFTYINTELEIIQHKNELKPFSYCQFFPKLKARGIVKDLIDI